jgi:hypothetical protein
MKVISLIFFLILFFACNGQRNQSVISSMVNDIPARVTLLNEKEIKSADSLNIKYQIRGFCYAYSSDKNAIASNGEAHSENTPKKTTTDFPEKGIYITINEKEVTLINNNLLAHKMYLVNQTDTPVIFNAQDSRIDIVPEAQDKNGKWQSIGYLPLSSCGNSYHQVTLDKNEFWKFNIPVFKGNFKTKIRYTLYINREAAFYSNEIVAFINKTQFARENKQGHKAVNIMDPYYD